VFVALTSSVWADESKINRSEAHQINDLNKSSQNKLQEQNWGLAVGLRTARMPFDSEEETMTSFIPQFFFENDLIFLRGLEGGIKISRNDVWQLNGLVRLRYFDIPKRFQSEIQENTVDLGFQLLYLPGAHTFVELELLSDKDFRVHSNIRAGLELEHGALEWSPFVNFNVKNSDFNDYYYGLDKDDIGAGVDISAGISTQYHLVRNLYLTGSFQLTWLDPNVRGSRFVDKEYLDETFIGLKLSNGHKYSRKKTLRNTPYMRIAHGWGTPSNISDIISGITETDRYNNQLTSVFYGHPLTDEIFDLPLDIYLTPGVVWHWRSKVQPRSQEYIAAIKAYYTFKQPVTWRFGVAEGISYITQVTYIEENELSHKDYEVSRLMNYLDLSLDVNIGELFHTRSLNSLWLGYYIHHRSAVFGTSSHFGRIKGGSNYNAVYLQWHL